VKIKIKKNGYSDVLTVVFRMIYLLWDVTPCILVITGISKECSALICLILNVKTLDSFRRRITIYHSTQRNIIEDLNRRKGINSEKLHKRKSKLQKYKRNTYTFLFTSVQRNSSVK